MNVVVGREVFRLKMIDGPVSADGTTAAIEIDYAGREFRLSSRVPEHLRPVVLAAAVNTVWQRRTVPVIHPAWAP